MTLTARDPQRLDAVATDIRARGADVLTITGDAASEDDLRRIAQAHSAEFDRLDVLILAAGVGSAGKFSSFPLHRFDKQLSVNVRAPFLLCQLLLPLLRTTAGANLEWGAKIVAVSSITGVAAEPDLAAYGASKAALISLCESITVAEAGNHVTASAVSPGYVDTDMSAWVHQQVAPADMITADDVAEIVAAMTKLSPNAVIPNAVLTRPGKGLWRA